jgi:uncharacterized membrane protein
MRRIRPLGFAVFFVIAGINHFVSPAFYLKIIPPYLPAHEAINLVSGAAEVLIGLAYAVPRLRLLGAVAAIALLLAVFPANIYVFQHRAELFPNVPTILHALRLPLQAVFIGWAYWAASLGRPAGRG